MRKFFALGILAFVFLAGCGGAPNSTATAYLNNEPKTVRLVEVAGIMWEGIEVIIDGESVGIAETAVPGLKGAIKGNGFLKRNFGPLNSKYGTISIVLVINYGDGLIGEIGGDRYFDVRLDDKHWVIVDHWI